MLPRARVTLGVNDLASQRPDVAISWSSRNPMGPDEVSVKSNRTVLWTCPDFPHEYTARVANRTVTGQGCPYCSGRKVLVRFNDLASQLPELSGEVSENSVIQPQEVTVGSEKVLTWVCKKFGHEYDAPVKKRTGRGDGCGVCRGRQVLRGFNDLYSQYPDLVPEYSDKNDRKSWEVTYGSTYLAEWICRLCTHPWTSTVNNRTNSKSGCPECAKKYRKGEDSLYEKVSSEYSKKIIRNTKKIVPPLELDIWLPELQLAFEYNGEYWHGLPKAIERDARKAQMCSERGITLVVIPERDWLDRREETEELVVKILKQAQEA